MYLRATGRCVIAGFPEVEFPPRRFLQKIPSHYLGAAANASSFFNASNEDMLPHISAIRLRNNMHSPSPHCVFIHTRYYCNLSLHASAQNGH